MFQGPGAKIRMNRLFEATFVLCDFPDHHRPHHRLIGAVWGCAYVGVELSVVRLFNAVSKAQKGQDDTSGPSGKAYE